MSETGTVSDGIKEISTIAPFTKKAEIVHVPASRIIGREVRNGGKLGNTAPKLWDEVYADGTAAALKSLPRVSASGLFGWTCDFDPETNTFSYIVCALTPAGTPVPEGFEFRDIPETLCAVGCYGESVYRTLQRAKAIGFAEGWNVSGCGWNAELYFDEEEAAPPKKNCKPWHWLVPVVKM